MAVRRQIPLELQQRIRERAKYLCEYCHTSEVWQYVPFTVDHIIPVSQGGPDVFDNLCLACFHCNRRKSSYITAVDPVTETRVALFHPRKKQWNEHFIWSSDKLRIISLTPTGRATVMLLELNRERAIRIRAVDLVVGRQPPQDDRIQTSD